MRLLLGSGDREVADALAPAFAEDRMTTVELGAMSEPDAFTTVDSTAPDAVLVVPDWVRADTDELRGCWWLARAADLARTPVVLQSTAEVFDPSDRRPRSEFDRPAPATAAGRLADAAEQLLQWTTRRLVIARTGPLDRGSRSLATFADAADGVIGGADAMISPMAVGALGPSLRALMAGRRYGIWHLVAGTSTLGDAARRHGWAPPRHGDKVAPPPLTSVMAALSADTVATTRNAERGAERT